jgi:hypothetical protein
VTADGAYDTRRCHNAIADRGASAVIPPRRNAQPWKPTTAGAIARNDALRIEVSGPVNLAELERLPPTEPRRNQDTLHETTRPTPDSTGLRPPGRGGPGARCNSERLHRPWHSCHESCGINPSGERGGPVRQLICATESAKVVVRKIRPESVATEQHQPRHKTLSGPPPRSYLSQPSATTSLS